MPEIRMYKGDDEEFEITVKGPDNITAENITGYTLFMTVKINRNDSDSIALISKTQTNLSDPENGIGTISVNRADTENIDANDDSDPYFYDFQIKDTDGKIKTLERGYFYIEQDITTRTS